MSPADQLRQILRASGLTQANLASQLGVSFVTLNSWINGKSTPRRKALSKLEAAYLQFVGGTPLSEENRFTLISAAEKLSFDAHRLTSDPRLFERLVVAMTYHTDAIEGSTMTLPDTRAVLLEGRTLANRTWVEQLEARNHHAALTWLLGEFRADGFVVSEALILGLHLRLTNGILSDAGSYRKHAVRIAGTRVVVANPLRIHELIRDLCRRIPSAEKTPVRTLAFQHAAFEKIHPFADGNGRVGRLLLFALALGANRVPPVVQRERRAVYFRALELAQVKENMAPLEQFLAESMLATWDFLKRK
ncbi:MAG: Fic family protein [Myxococcaceae bacterium]